MARRLAFGLSLVLMAAAGLGLAAVVHQWSVQTAGAVDGLPDPALAPRPANLRAVNVQLENATPAAREQSFARLHAFGWLRQTFTWSADRPPDWDRWDALLAAAHSHGYRVIAVLANARPSGPPDPGAFTDFAAAFAGRYRRLIDVYQVWDEPNLSAAWGGPPSAPAYAAMLVAAYPAIHAADPGATVLAAALAPTVEAGPDNISDLIFLQQLYDLGAGPAFDAAVGKPYGFYSGPDDRRADPSLLNFSRFILLRQVMERNGDGRKLLWGGNFGWNVLASPWGTATPAEQAAYTAEAFARAEQEWPWAGPLALELDQPAAPPDDARWGFALAGPDGALTSLGRAWAQPAAARAAPPGNYPADAPAALYTGAWSMSELGADIPPEDPTAQVAFQFQGSDLALRVRRGDYRGYLYITVDGQPANRLPSDERGAYLVLTAPDLRPVVETIPVADGLDPQAVHTAVIVPERGWGQWALAGFSVGRRLPAGGLVQALMVLAAMAALGLAGAAWSGRGWAGDGLRQRAGAAWARLGEAGQLAVTALTAAGLYFSAWWTFENEAAALTRRLGDTAPLVLTALSAGVFYFSPSVLAAAAALAALFVLFILRLDIALAFVAAFIPFYLFPRLLWERGASVLEFSLWLAAAAWLVRRGPAALQQLRQRGWPGTRLDAVVLTLLVVGAASTLAADQRQVAVYEFRTVLLGFGLYYGLVRATPLDEQAVWRIVDFFILGAVAVAAIGLYQAVSGAGLIVTEEGVARIRSVYGSPNNLALYLERALPLALAVAGLGGSAPPGRQAELRRWAYGAAALVMAVALVLTVSRGALVLGLPAALAVLAVGRLGRRGAWAVAAAAALGLAALPLLAQVPRFADLLNPQAGTGFFRVNVWLSAWRMAVDHPWLGVGPDNFLYAYRGFYILPQAWQEPNLSHPHNWALDFLSRLGVFGLLCALLLFGGTIGRLVQALRSGQLTPAGRALAIGLLAQTAGLLAHGLVDHSFFLVDLATAFALTAALAQRLPRKSL